MSTHYKGSRLSVNKLSCVLQIGYNSHKCGVWDLAHINQRVIYIYIYTLDVNIYVIYGFILSVSYIFSHRLNKVEVCGTHICNMGFPLDLQ